MTNLSPPTQEPAAPVGREARVQALYGRFLHIENLIHHQLVKHSITALRIALGLVFLGFGILKYFPGVSPAQNITEATTHILFLTLIPGSVAIKMIATLECVIGLCLLTNRFMRLAVWLLAIEFIGILSPVFLFPARLFSGPHHAPTLLGQYCLKDIILIAGGLVVTAASFRGGRMIRTDLDPNVRAGAESVIGPEQKLRIVLDGINDPEGTSALLKRNHVTEADFHAWRDAAMAAATLALAAPAQQLPPSAIPD
jgi:putative oxidoreductase